MATAQDGVTRATAIVAALREEYSGERLLLALIAECKHAARIAVDGDEEWQAREGVYLAAIREESVKQSA